MKDAYFQVLFKLYLIQVSMRNIIKNPLGFKGEVV